MKLHQHLLTAMILNMGFWVGGTGTARAAWPLDGAAVCTAAAGQHLPESVPDGVGGAIVTWYDYRGGFANIYVQRLNASGAPLWATDGVALSTAGALNPTIVSDGVGGAIIAWEDYRSGIPDIYAQRVNASGVRQWAANGVALCTAASDQSEPMVASDGAGGAIVTWYDRRALGLETDIYAQRVTASGTPAWAPDGQAVCTAPFQQYNPTIVSDGAGGAIMTWFDWRSGATFDIYAQRVAAAGMPQWGLDGVAICTASNTQYYPTIASDGAGGAIVTWFDYRAGDSHIYVQRVDASGVSQWAFNGVNLCAALNGQEFPLIVSDGAGGAIVAWQDYRNGASTDIYARRVNASGVPQWTSNGVALCVAASDQQRYAMVSDGAGGAIVCWDDLRSGGTYDVYAQRISFSGTVLWTADGAVVSTAASDQQSPAIVMHAAGAVLIAWNDSRKGDYDIYAQRLELEEGTWGYPEPTVTSVSDVPGDQGGKVKVNWQASGWDVRHYDTITHYSIWRATDAVALANAPGARVDDPSAVGPDFGGPAFRVEETASGTPYYWEWIGNQNVLYSPGYSFSASTRNDSTSQDSGVHYFQVVSHTSDPFLFWASNAIGGYSVDNLAPAAPLMLTAQRIGGDVRLRWNRVLVPDLRDYSVYRKTSAGVTPVPMHFLTSANDTVLIDTAAPASALYYIVTAFDLHENQSAASNEASVSPATHVGNTPSITALTVLQNHPNPFAGSTELEIGLPANSDLEVEVYDVAGRRVRTQTLAQQTAGWQKVAFDGRDGAGRLLPSGVYFYRVTANGTTVTRKMVIAR